MRKFLLSIGCFVLFLVAQTQPDSIRKIEPNKETSFDNYELLVIAVIGLLLLIGLRFLIWKKRKR